MIIERAVMRCTICDTETELVEFSDEGKIKVVCQQCRTVVYNVNNNLDLENLRFGDWERTNRNEKL